jgi:uncharacterized membrane protein
MGRFLAVFAAFLIAHVIPAAPATRRRLIGWLGEGTFIAVYSLMSLALFAWLISATLAAPYIPVWPKAPWTYGVPLVLLPLALVLLGAGFAAPNPLSIAFVTTPYAPSSPGVVAVTRHPILWGLGLWGLAHVPPNGNLAALILFGGLGGFAFLGMALVEARRQRALGEARWHELAAPTSVLPFGALLAGRARWPRDPRTLVGGGLGLCAAVLLLAGGHLWLFGRDPLAVF